uniref:Uncharacterized protein n=1 Tax=Glossina austeni TaxID=7395 RepID=A0A1A9V316_GLOAU
MQDGSLCMVNEIFKKLYIFVGISTILNVYIDAMHAHGIYLRKNRDDYRSAYNQQDYPIHLSGVTTLKIVKVASARIAGVLGNNFSCGLPLLTYFIFEMIFQNTALTSYAAHGS